MQLFIAALPMTVIAPVFRTALLLVMVQSLMIALPSTTIAPRSWDRRGAEAEVVGSGGNRGVRLDADP